MNTAKPRIHLLLMEPCANARAHMHAFLIIGKNQKERNVEIEKQIASKKISSWDIIRLSEEPRIGIGDIREFERYLRLAPQQSKVKAGVLTTIDRLTPEAQNALLKTLEEPPPNTYIFAETEFPEQVLPTVFSRFSLVNIGATPRAAVDEKINQEFIEQLFVASPGRRMQLVDPFVATRDDAALLITKLMNVARDMMLKKTMIPPKKLAKFIKNLSAGHSQLSVNVNQKLVIDTAVIRFV